jgi:hypothetical protein
VSSVEQQPTSTATQPLSALFGPVNRDGCVSSVNGTTPVGVPQSAPQPEVFRGHILDPEVAAIPRVPDDSQQVTTGPQPEITADTQPSVLTDPNAPTGPQRNILTDPNAPTGPRRRTPKQPVTGSQRRFKTARRSYF